MVILRDNSVDINGMPKKQPLFKLNPLIQQILILSSVLVALATIFAFIGGLYNIPAKVDATEKEVVVHTGRITELEKKEIISTMKYEELVRSFKSIQENQIKTDSSLQNLNVGQQAILTELKFIQEKLKSGAN